MFKHPRHTPQISPQCFSKADSQDKEFYYERCSCGSKVIGDLHWVEIGTGFRSRIKPYLRHEPQWSLSKLVIPTVRVRRLRGSFASDFSFWWTDPCFSTFVWRRTSRADKEYVWLIVNKIDPARNNKRLTYDGFEGNLLLFTSLGSKNLPSDTRGSCGPLQYDNHVEYHRRMMGLLAWSFSYSFVLPGINSRSWGLPLSPRSIGGITPTLCVWRSWYLIEFLYHTQPGRAPLDRSVDYIVHWSALPTPTHLSPNMLPVDDIQLSEQDHLLCCEMTMRKESASLPML